eukprot:TRINITY_DN19353_c0_g1_i1.p1 TRINITY_DN19353_c0_g1~~TRINITY_DN19353_c0_g1_i1.p1  ORF type:complete len:1700 (+),score=188.32 TRINITY_DN19353_c0_g1_i1:92-5191(+)
MRAVVPPTLLRCLLGGARAVRWCSEGVSRPGLRGNFIKRVADVEGLLLRLSGREAFATAGRLRHSGVFAEQQRGIQSFNECAVGDIDDPADDVLRDCVAGLLFAREHQECNPPPRVEEVRMATLTDDELAEVRDTLHPAQRACLDGISVMVHTRDVRNVLLLDPLWLSVWTETLIDALPLLEGKQGCGAPLSAFPHLGPHHDVYVSELRFLRALREALRLEGRYPCVFLKQRFERVVDAHRPEATPANPLPWAGWLSPSSRRILADPHLSSEQKHEQLSERGVTMHLAQVSNCSTAGKAYQKHWWNGLLAFGWAIAREGCPYQRFRVIADLLGFSVGTDERLVVPTLVASSSTPVRCRQAALLGNTGQSDVHLSLVDRSLEMSLTKFDSKFGFAQWASTTQSGSRLKYRRDGTAMARSSVNKALKHFLFWKDPKVFIMHFHELKKVTHGFTASPNLKPREAHLLACLRDFDEHNSTVLPPLLCAKKRLDLNEAVILLYSDGLYVRRAAEQFGYSGMLAGLREGVRMMALLACLHLRLVRQGQLCHGAVTEEELSRAGRTCLPPLRLIYIAQWIPRTAKEAVDAFWSRLMCPWNRVRDAEALGIPGTALDAAVGVLDEKRDTPARSLAGLEKWVSCALDFVVFAEHPLLTLGAREEALIKVFSHVDPDNYLVNGERVWNCFTCFEPEAMKGRAEYIRVSRSLYTALVRAQMGKKLRKRDVAAVDAWLALRVRNLAALQRDKSRRRRTVHTVPRRMFGERYVGLDYSPDADVDEVTAMRAGLAPPPRRIVKAYHLSPSRVHIRCREYLRSVVAHLVNAEPHERTKYYGPAEEVVRDYVARLHIPPNLLAIPYLQDEHRTWLAAVHKTLRGILETHKAPDDAIICHHRRLIAGHGNEKMPARLFRKVSRMPYFGHPAKVLVDAFTEFRGDCADMKKLERLGQARVLAKVLEDIGVPANPEQGLRLLENPAVAKKPSYRQWKRWMHFVLSNPNNCGSMNTSVAKAVRRLGLNERWLRGASRKKQEEVYRLLAAVLQGDVAPEDVCAKGRLGGMLCPVAANVFSLRWYAEGIVKRMPLVGAPSAHHIKLFSSMCGYGTRCTVGGRRHGVFFDKVDLRMEIKATLKADASGLALSIEQWTEYLQVGVQRPRRGVSLAEGAHRAAVKFMTTWHPVAAFRTWLLDVVRHGSPGPRLWFYGRLVHSITADLTAAQVESMSDAHLISVYNALATAMYTAATGMKDERVQVLDKFAWFAPHDGGDQSHLLFSNRLPYLPHGDTCATPPALLRAMHAAHAMIGDIIDPLGTHRDAKDFAHVFVVFVMRLLWEDGVPGSAAQILDALTGAQRWSQVGRQRALARDAGAAFVQWAVDVATSQGECLLRRRAAFGPDVELYDEVLKAIPSPQHWTAAERRVAYSRFAQAAPGPLTEGCGLLLAPRPASLSSPVTDAELSAVCDGRALLRVGVPPMPHLGLPLSDDHARLLGDKGKRWTSPELWYTEAHRSALPGTHEQAMAHRTVGQSFAERRDLPLEASCFRAWLSTVRRDYAPGPSAHSLVNAVHDLNLRDDLDKEGDAVLEYVFLRLLPVFQAVAQYGDRSAHVQNAVARKVTAVPLPDKPATDLVVVDAAAEHLVGASFVTAGLREHTAVPSMDTALGVIEDVSEDNSSGTASPIFTKLLAEATRTTGRSLSTSSCRRPSALLRADTTPS